MRPKICLVCSVSLFFISSVYLCPLKKVFKIAGLQLNKFCFYKKVSIIFAEKNVKIKEKMPSTGSRTSCV